MTGSDSTYLRFAGLENPVEIAGAEAALPLLSTVIPKWPATRGDPDDRPPFATLRARPGAAWEIEAHMGDPAPKRHDPVNALCDLIVEMSWERLRSDPDLLCLHAAAVAFGDHLVLFPSGRRSGKSTLTAALARAGHEVFSDDFVPIAIGPNDRRVEGLANGIAPRLRLPLPGDASETFRAWVDADPGPSNGQYKYLAGAPLADAEVRRPVGAIVLLDRQDTPTTPRLEALRPDEALSLLVLQNFARTVHAGRILKTIAAMVASLPVFRLRYTSFEAAAEALAQAPELSALADVRLPPTVPTSLAAALPDTLDTVELRFDDTAAYVQRPAVTEVETGGESFLADHDGTAIHRLNAGSAIVWRLLGEPMTLAEVTEVMQELFPEVDPAQIRRDADLVLRQFVTRRLVEPRGR